MRPRYLSLLQIPPGPLPLIHLRQLLQIRSGKLLQIRSEKSSADTIAATGTLPVSLEKSDNPFQRFLDSLRYSKGQVRIIYYGDSQIEGDRVTSFLRNTLRKGRGGTGPGLFLPVMPVMYTKSVWIRSSSNWKRYNYLSYKSGEISHRNLGPFMAICRYLPDGERPLNR